MNHASFMLNAVKISLLLCLSAFTLSLFAEPPFRGRIVLDPVERFLPPHLAPVPDGIYTEVPKELGNQALAEKGFLDVTAAPFHADPTGKKDSTTALQAAIEFARERSFVCFFPKGTYRVSETLVCRAAYRWRSHQKAVQPDKSLPNVLMGSRLGEESPSYQRPRIILSKNSPAFQNEGAPSYVVDYQIFSFNVGGEKKSLDDRDKGIAQQYKMNFAESKYNSFFNQLFVNIDIEIESGNPGAVGLRLNSAEGSGVQEVTIHAGDGFAGMEGGSGNGGSWNNIAIRGGRFGVDLGYGGVPTPVITGLKLSGQRESAVRSRVRGSLVIAGMEALFSGSGPVVAVPMGEGRKNLDGAVTVVDASVVFEKDPGVFVSAPDVNVVLHNVFLKNAAEILEGFPGNPNGWIQVKDLARGLDFQVEGETFASAPVLGGKKSSTKYSRLSAGTAPPADLVSRHELPVPFPNFESPGVTDVRRYGAVGDSRTDDTAAIQRAIDENKIVFIPKGYFRLTRSLRLKPDTQLVGAGQALSILTARDPEPTDTPWPLVQTADDASSKNILAFVGLRTPLEYKKNGGSPSIPVFALRWSCGSGSLFRSVDTQPLRIYGFIQSKDHAFGKLTASKIQLTPNAGGRFYNFPVEDGHIEVAEEYRAMLVEGAKGPVSFYAFEPQQAKNGLYSEFRSAKNISIFGFKSEGNATILSVKYCDNIRIFGYGGNATARPGDVMLRIENTPNWLVANFCDQFLTGTETKALEAVRYHYSKYHSFEEIIGGHALRLAPSERPVLLKRGYEDND